MRSRSWLATCAALYIAVTGCTASLDDESEGASSGTGSTQGSGSTPGTGGGVGTGSTGTGTGGGGGTEVLDVDGLKLKGMPKYYRVVRLTHAQWENSVQDVLLLDAPTGLSTSFIPDPPDGKFSNNERALYVTDTLRTDYQRSAETVAETVATDAAQLAKLGAAGDSAGLIASVGKRAFRRDLTPEEKTAYEALWAEGATFYASGDAFADGARVFIEALLQSPHFIFKVELSPNAERLSGAELATKISFLLRNTTPDDELLNAAAAGALDTDDGVAQVVTQMLEEDDARSAVSNFHRELFGLDRYSSILKSTTTFPAYTEALNDVFYEADVMFFNHVYGQNLGLREILTSDVAFVNDATAPLYGVTATGSQLTQTLLDGSRPGFITRLGFLAYNANLSEPDPIHRGVEINNKLLCANLEPPAGEIPALPAPVPGQTNRERVTAHTGEGFCGNCHNEIINPPGFALESFDALGQFRTTDKDKPIDTTGTFAVLGGKLTFTSIVDLTAQLSDNKIAHACYAANLSEFAFARDIGAGESTLVTGLLGQSQDDDASIKTILLAIIKSPEFTSARSGNP